MAYSLDTIVVGVAVCTCEQQLFQKGRGVQRSQGHGVTATWDLPVWSLYALPGTPPHHSTHV